MHDYVSFKAFNISYRIKKRVVCNCMSKYWGKKARRNKERNIFNLMNIEIQRT